MTSSVWSPAAVASVTVVSVRVGELESSGAL
eukprot:CAMPEP_0184520124 /NCGR_PEP_ID=MMETSP0198_2-20121128/6997_1 /TAXON_ID=1112570 /ORGANISM="Thraustochytrium sp., Strain LLF1b" /LENGTH=30 /DNA_ID= /DNA_START= /DNA_END= /DNA_ORIENTATION=